MGPPRERDGVGRWAGPTAGAACASMGPPRERDGVQYVAMMDPATRGLQWGRRANATECTSPRARRLPRRGFNGAARANATEWPAAELALGALENASMGPPRERDGVKSRKN